MLTLISCAFSARDGNVDLNEFTPHLASTVRLHDRSLKQFAEWIFERSGFTNVEVLLDCPRLMRDLARSFGLHLFECEFPLYVFLYFITALQKFRPALRPHLADAWAVAHNWRALVPIVHRRPLPAPVFQAMVSLAVQLGWWRWAGIAIIAFCSPARVGEPLRSSRSDLVLPRDVLQAAGAKAFLRVRNPKSAFRGGAAQQHCTVRGPLQTAFLEGVFGALGGSEALYPFSASSFRGRWDHLLSLLGISSDAHLTPGGLRGGGAVAAYALDVSVDELVWRMRLRSQQTLVHYLQEVTALSSMRDLCPRARESVLLAARCYSRSLRLGAGSASASSCSSHPLEPFGGTL